jgi:excisionase family DNA binding protein
LRCYQFAAEITTWRQPDTPATFCLQYGLDNVQYGSSSTQRFICRCFVCADRGYGVSASRPRSPKAPVPRLALSLSEAAASLGVSADYFSEHVAGELRWVRRGRLRLVAVAELDRWLDREAARTLDGDL